MRLSQWKARAPSRDAMGAKVLGVLQPVLEGLGVGADPECWIVWGDEPGSRYIMFAPGAAGLVVCHVRANVAGEGPRAAAKVVRWPRAQLGELATETQQGHRLTSFQVEGHVLRGVDAEADRVAAFAIGLLAAADGRAVPSPPSRKGRTPAGRTPAGRTPAGRTPAARARPESPTAAATRGDGARSTRARGAP